MGFKIGFGEPAWLLLLALLPLIWLWSYRSLAGLGRTRRFVALALRSLLIAILVFGLAEVQLLKISERVTVIYLLDQSASIPEAKRSAMLEYVVNDVAEHRNGPRQDRVGIIVFGKEALIEFPPMEADIPSVGVLESAYQLHRDATDLAGALKLAQASFAEDSAKRIVVVTDGNENLGDARAIVPQLAEQGIGIDVVPIQLELHGEVAVEKVSMPSDIRRGQPIEARISLVNHGTAPVAGRLAVIRRAGNGDEQTLDQQPVVLPPGKSIFRVPHEIDSPDVYTYRAVFTADDPAQDLLVQNNEATAFTYVKGRGRLLVIQDWENPGEFDYLVERLRANNLEVQVRGSDAPFTTLAELQGFDCVILANCPRGSAAGDGDKVTNFSDDQIRMLVHYVEHLGGGVVMLGGPNSFGAGGWTGTDLEKAMPVDFQIDNDKVRAIGALVLMMHASELAQGNYWQKKVAEESIKTLGPMDYCGLIHWDDSTGRDNWLWGAPKGLVPIGGQRNMMLATLGRMAPGDMPDFEPAMRLSLAAFRSVTNAAAKHMIVISDGDPTPPNPATVQAYVRDKIQISTVAIGTHGPAGNLELQQLANTTGGKYYVVRDPKALPRIYQVEARKVARPLVFEPEGGVQPQVTYAHEMHSFLNPGDPLPRIGGFVFTTVKDSPLVEVSIRSPLPTEAKNSTILASWQYGQGRTAVLTTDAGRRWANSWTDWGDYDRFFTQLIRWAMRPVDDDANFSVTSEIKDGVVRVAVTALDAGDRYLNNLDMQATAVAPDLSTFDVPIQQVAPGRYEASFPADSAGDYLLTVIPGMMTDPTTGQQRMRAPVVGGVTVPYSAEYRDRETNLALLRALAGIKPKGGEPGQLVLVDVSGGKPLPESNSFRHDLEKAVSIHDYWHLFLLVGAFVFLADVFVRRVTPSFDWARPYLARVTRLWRREEPAAEDQRLERLRSRKAEVAAGIDEQRRAAARFQPDASDAENAPELDDVLRQSGGGAGDRPERPAPSQPSIQAGQEEESYTSRLMKAKQDAMKKRKQ